MSAWPAVVWAPERRELWLTLLRALPDEVVETIGREDVDELAGALATDGLVVVSTEPVPGPGPSAPDTPGAGDHGAAVRSQRRDPRRDVARLPAGARLALSDRACAELLLATEILRRVAPALGPSARDAISEIEAAGRSYRRIGSDVETTAPDAGMTGSRSFHDPINSVEAARILGCTEQNVTKLARHERLAGRAVGGNWMFERSDVVARARDRAVDDAPDSTGGCEAG